jgi:hypothetical protein
MHFIVPECSADSVVGSTCKLPISKVRPTQFTIGQVEVDCKVQYFQSLSADELENELVKDPTPMYVGPNSLNDDGVVFYITDGHHLARTMFEANFSFMQQDEKYLYATVEGNWRGLKKRSYFLQALVASGLTWLYDEEGNQPMVLTINLLGSLSLVF